MEENKKNLLKPRLVFLDNVRFFIILFVILQHVALIFNAYSVNTNISRSVNNIIVSITDIFMMPIMFFIAGFFALSSIQLKGTAQFIKSKVHRIWLPWFIGVTLIVPIAVYFMYYMRSVNGGESPMAYLDYWVMLMKSAGEFHTGFISSQDQFSHKHLWFLSVLFAFFVVFSILYEISKKWTDRSGITEIKKPPSDKTILLSLILLGILSTAGFFAVKLFFRWGYQATLIAGLIHFDPSRLVVFSIYFAFGIYANSREWFSSDRGLGRLMYWVPFCLLMFGIYMYLSFSDVLTLTTGVKFIFSFLRSFLCLSIFVVLMTFACRFWNQRSPVNQKLASNSYTIYVIHYPIHVVAAMLLMNVNAYLPVKFVIAYLVTFITSYALSQYVIKPYPRLSVIGIAVINIVMFYEG